jgi:hypothetical protein
MAVAAAALLVVLVAEAEEAAEPEPLDDGPAVVDGPALEEVEPTPVAFNDPQLKLKQKFCPTKLLGLALTHCATHSSHSRDGRVWP